MEAKRISTRSFSSEISDAHIHNQKSSSVPLRYAHLPTPSQAHEVRWACTGSHGTLQWAVQTAPAPGPWLSLRSLGLIWWGQRWLILQWVNETMHSSWLLGIVLTWTITCTGEFPMMKTAAVVMWLMKRGNKWGMRGTQPVISWERGMQSFPSQLAREAAHSNRHLKHANRRLLVRTAQWLVMTCKMVKGHTEVRHQGKLHCSWKGC